MSLPNAVETALRRLSAALDLLEAAAERRERADQARGNVEEELAVMQDDRTRLAVELDGAVARSRSLDLTHQEVARRLARAHAAVEQALAAEEMEG